ncbi:hypothetical protein K0M31_009632 [Melipona bicolor]|uniref:Uncharacterized protein n=1 Tax=Melipona bicolor TaxID=60889 RepID=A0AA40FP91_9HYME|nr:hypothetical protein K0M31_009632 [Melipona bicolor]
MEKSPPDPPDLGSADGKKRSRPEVEVEVEVEIEAMRALPGEQALIEISPVSRFRNFLSAPGFAWSPIKIYFD